MHRPWLKSICAPGAAPIRASAVVLSADALGAVVFALGLACAIAALPAGLSAIAPWLLLCLAGAMLRGALFALAARLSARGAAVVKVAVRGKATRAALAAPPGGRQTAGGLMAAAVEGVEALDGYVARFVPARTAAAIAPVVVLAAIGFASPVAAGILAFALAPFVLGLTLAGMAAAEESKRQFAALSRLSGLFLDRVRGLPLVLAYEAQNAQTAALATAADALQQRTARILKRAFLSSAVLEFFAALSVALAAVYCGFNLLGILPFPAPETVTLAQAFFVLALAPEVYAPMRRLAAVYHDRQAAEAAASALAIEATPVAGRLAPLVRAPSIRFEAVRLTYPQGERAVFDGFDLDLSPGSTTAIIGPSGSGKSSLLHLLLGLAPLTGGEVFVGDRRLSQTGGFASLASWAGQSPLITPGSVADNIALARPQARRDEIKAVAARVGLGGVTRRAGGLDAALDERGAGLSGGERRRIALARALLKDAPLLLLDEPTANLDAAAEAALLPVIAQAARGRTVIIATHSEAVAALAGQVVRL